MTCMTLVVMAAGMGSRFGGIKQIAQIGEHKEIIIDYSVFDAKRAGFDKFVFVIREEIEKDFCEVFFDRIKDKVNATYVFQKSPEWRKKPLGTLHAVLAAKDEIDGPFCVINADDFYGKCTFQKAVDVKGNAIVVYDLENTLSDSGAVTRGLVEVDVDGNLFDVVETFDIVKSDIPDRLPYGTKANVNFFVFEKEILELLQEIMDEFMEELGNDQKKEAFLPGSVGQLIKEGIITVKVIESCEKWVGCTYKEDKEFIKEHIKQLIADGVYKENLWEEIAEEEKVEIE